MKEEISLKAFEKGFEIAKDLLQKIIAPPVEQIGLLMADQVRYWRFKNQVRLLEKAHEYIKKKKVEIKEVPLKIIAPLLEGASLEENESLREMWVALLVNYIDSRKHYRSSVFPYILTQISTEEVRFLELFKNHDTIIDFDDIPLDYEILDAELSNLVRLGLIRLLPHKLNISKVDLNWSGDVNEVETEYDMNDLRYELTELGWEFIQACKLED